MIYPCDKSCGNKTASGYCATTACINPQYSNFGTAQYGQGVQKRIITNADRIRAMTDEELAEMMVYKDCPTIEMALFNCPEKYCPDGETHDCHQCWLDWLKQEVVIDE